VRRSVVYSHPGTYTVRVPVPRARAAYKKKLGMSSMNGAHGFLKGYPANYLAYNASAPSSRIDDMVTALQEGGEMQHVCMFKADVEGYEAQVLRTAHGLLHRRGARSLRPQAIQLEITRAGSSREERSQIANETAAMLEDLAGLGYSFRQVPGQLIDSNASLPRGAWHSAPGVWAALPRFPTAPAMGMRTAYTRDIRGFSTNLVAALEAPVASSAQRCSRSSVSVNCRLVAN